MPVVNTKLMRLGDRVFVLREGGTLLVCKVSNLTKTGQVTVDAEGYTKRFSSVGLEINRDAWCLDRLVTEDVYNQKLAASSLVTCS